MGLYSRYQDPWPAQANVSAQGTRALLEVTQARRSGPTQRSAAARGHKKRRALMPSAPGAGPLNAKLYTRGRREMNTTVHLMT